MVEFYELEDVTLLPAVVNQGYPGAKANFLVMDPIDGSSSLPIFASPMEAIVDETSARVFFEAGIKPVLPETIPLNTRLSLAGVTFCAFTLKEIRDNFLSGAFRGQGIQHICIDAGNGHDVSVLQTGWELKKRFDKGVVLMGGNIGLPEVYKDYSNAGFDYVRVGLSSGFLVDRSKYGFHYPMASLLDDLKKFKTSGPGKGLREVKIIADGGIRSFSDILKALALGADYVMIGYEFARVLESAGAIYKRGKDSHGEQTLDEIDPTTLLGMSGFKAKLDGLCRQYFGNTSHENRAKLAGYQDVEQWKRTKPKIRVSDTAWSWVNIDTTLQEWIDDFRHCAYYGFMMTGSNNWEEFKKNAKYGVM